MISSNGSNIIARSSIRAMSRWRIRINFVRIHLLCGDSNMAEYATALKMGTTGVVLQLIEDGHAPRGLDISEPVDTMRELSRDLERTWIVTLESGKTISAIDLQRRFLEAAQQHYKGQDDDTDWVLEQWEAILGDLSGEDYTKLVGRVDWASKLWLLETFRGEDPSIRGMIPCSKAWIWNITTLIPTGDSISALNRKVVRHGSLPTQWWLLRGWPAKEYPCIRTWRVGPPPAELCRSHRRTNMEGLSPLHHQLVGHPLERRRSVSDGGSV